MAPFPAPGAGLFLAAGVAGAGLPSHAQGGGGPEPGPARVWPALAERVSQRSAAPAGRDWSGIDARSKKWLG